MAGFFEFLFISLCFRSFLLIVYWMFYGCSFWNILLLDVDLGGFFSWGGFHWGVFCGGFGGVVCGVVGVDVSLSVFWFRGPALVVFWCGWCVWGGVVLLAVWFVVGFLGGFCVLGVCGGVGDVVGGSGFVGLSVCVLF